MVLGFDSAEFTNGTKRAINSTKGFTQASKAMEAAAGTLANALRGIGGALGVIGVGSAAKEFLDLASKSQQMTASLKLATAEFGRYAQAQADVRKISSDTRSGLEDTAKLYGNITRNAKDLGITQADAARATETIAKTFKISGAGAVEASQATRQLIQALQSGVLRGDEFNSVMESSPRLTKLLADSLGVPIGALRAMAEAGDLTSDKLVKAFTDKKFTAGIDAEFRELPVTFDQAMEQVQNAAITVFGAFDTGGQFSTDLANFVIGGTKGFADLEGAAVQFGVAVRSSFDGLRALVADTYGKVASLVGLLSQIPGVGLVKKFNDLVSSVSPIGFAQTAIFGNSVYQKAAASSQSKLQGQADEARFRTMSSGFDALGNPTGGAAATPYKPVDKKAAAAAASAAKKAASASNPKAKAEADYTAEALYDFQRDVADASVNGAITMTKSDQISEDYRWEDSVAAAQKSLEGLGDRFKQTSKEGSESMANLANNVLNSLSGLANSIKSGGFLDIISAAFNAFGSVAKTGILGKGLGTSFKDFTSISGFRANGGSVTGGSTYVVGERGPELFTATQSGYIHPNGANDNGGRGMQVQVVKGDLFDVIVTGISDSRVSAAAPSIVSGASRGTQTAMQRRASRRLA